MTTLYTLYWTGVLPHTVICHQFAFVTMEPSQQDNWKRKSALFFFNFLNSLDAAEVSIVIKEEIKDNLGWIPESQPCQLWKTAFLSLIAAKTKYVVKNTHMVVPATVNVQKNRFLKYLPVEKFAFLLVLRTGSFWALWGLMSPHMIFICVWKDVS